MRERRQHPAYEIVNRSHGFDHTGKRHVGVPAIFGMNFQSVGVGQKLVAAARHLRAPGPFAVSGRRSSAHSALMPRSRMTVCQRAVSSCMYLVNSAGVPATGSMPLSASFRRMSGEAMVLA